MWPTVYLNSGLYINLKNEEKRMDLLKKTLKASAIGAITASLAFGVMDAKAETAGTNITATVQNAFTFVETTALTFGTFVAINDTVDSSTIAIDAAGANVIANPGNARIVAITPGTNGVFDVSAAVPSTTINVTLPTTVTLNCAACTGAQADFDVGTFVDDSTAGVITTDASGAVTLNVGATLSTVPGAAIYEDGSYAGAYTVTANY